MKIVRDEDRACPLAVAFGADHRLLPDQGAGYHRSPSLPQASGERHVWMTLGRPRPLPGYHATPASYPVSVRRIPVQGLGFLQIPPHGGHLCLALRFRSSRPAEDLHLLPSRHAWHTKKGTCEFSQVPSVEAAGIAPASREASATASTCVADRLIVGLGAPIGKVPVGLARHEFNPSRNRRLSSGDPELASPAGSLGRRPGAGPSAV